MIDQIHWLGHASFRIEGPPLIYVNPWRVARTAFLADVILLSNDQYDHCSPADVEKLRGPNTVIVGNAQAASIIGSHVVVLRPWQSLNIGAARITAVPAYTYTNHHPVSKGGLGFMISIGYYDIYYAGCTDFVPELNRIRADVAILPLAAGEGTMSMDNLAALARSVNPSWVIPSHWGSMNGTQHDVQALARAIQPGESEVVQVEKIR